MRFKTGGAACLIGCLALSGCGRKPLSPARPATPASPKTESVNNVLPGKVQGKGWRIFWRTQDAKQTAPERATPVLIAEAQRGELINDDAIPAVRLIGVRAKLFRDGVHSANMTAGQIEANRKERRVVGTGGVTIRSLTNPPDTVIIADTLTWDTSADQIIAEGNATVRKPARRGALPFLAENVQRVRFDTRLEKFRIE